jgi:hypothetical protein
MTRSKSRELAKKDQPQKLYANVVKNSAQNNRAQQTSVNNQEGCNKGKSPVQHQIKCALIN